MVVSTLGGFDSGALKMILAMDLLGRVSQAMVFWDE